MEFIGTYLVKTIKMLIFWHKTFLKTHFTKKKKFHLIFMMLQIDYTNQFLNLAENMLFMHFKKVKFPQISTRFSKTL